MAVCRSDEIHLEWQNLSYKVKNTRFQWKHLQSTETTVHVLKEGFLIYLIHKRVTFNSGLSFYIVSGSITAGEMVAIIGPRYTFDIYSVKYT